jgi:hypothetical protein
MSSEKINLDPTLVKLREFLNTIIKKFCKAPFKEIEDVDIENLREFLIPIIENFRDNKIPVRVLNDIGDGMHTYIHRRFGDEYPETSYPDLPKTDWRSIGLDTLDYMYGIPESFIMLPEDAPYFIKFLKTPIGQEEEAHKKIREYISQFEIEARTKEAAARGYFDKEKQAY